MAIKITLLEEIAKIPGVRGVDYDYISRSVKVVLDNYGRTVLQWPLELLESVPLGVVMERISTEIDAAQHRVSLHTSGIASPLMSPDLRWGGVGYYAESDAAYSSNAERFGIRPLIPITCSPMYAPPETEPVKAKTKRRVRIRR